MTEQLAERVFLLRLAGEFSVKSRRTQKRFRQRLLRNLRDALEQAGSPFRIEDRWSRIFVHADADAGPTIGRVFGIGSLSPIDRRVSATVDDIVRAGAEAYAGTVQDRAFAVRARRSGTHDFRSKDIEIALGAALDGLGRVDLTAPDVTVGVEVRDEDAYLFSSRLDGAGGLPLGVEGRALALVSGGFDSAVASWLMLKRGVQLDYVFCNLAGQAYERSVVQVAKVLADKWSYGTRPRLHVIDFGPVLDNLRAHSQPKYWQLVLKRLMYRAAERVAREVGADAIVTGEAMGQVSSQTLANLAAIDPAVDLVVFRPLLGFDKTEIIDRSRRIGTFEISALVKEYCAISPGNPVTHASREAAAKEESRLDLEILHAAVTARRVIDIRKLNSADLVEDYLYAEAIPEGAVVIDIRGEGEGESWQYPGALRQDVWDVAGHVGEMDADRTYVVYCDAGMQAVLLAEQMQRAGLEAFAFRGGTRALRKLTEAPTAV